MKTRVRYLALAVAASGTGCMGATHAANGDAMFKLNGFAAVGLSHSYSKLSDFSSVVLHPRVTRKNSSNGEEPAATVQEMSGQATQLQEVMSFSKGR